MSSENVVQFTAACKECENAAAVFKCVQCTAEFCSECFDQVHKPKVLRHHRKHLYHDDSYACFICTMTVSEHFTTTIQQYDVVNPSSHNTDNSPLDVTANCALRTDLQKLLETFQHTYSQYYDGIDKTKIEVTQYFEKLRKILEEKEKWFFEEIDRIINSNRRFYEKSIKSIEALKDHVDCDDFNVLNDDSSVLVKFIDYVSLILHKNYDVTLKENFNAERFHKEELLSLTYTNFESIFCSLREFKPLIRMSENDNVESDIGVNDDERLVDNANNNAEQILKRNLSDSCERILQSSSGSCDNTSSTCCWSNNHQNYEQKMDDDELLDISTVENEFYAATAVQEYYKTKKLRMFDIEDEIVITNVIDLTHFYARLSNNEWKNFKKLLYKSPLIKVYNINIGSDVLLKTKDGAMLRAEILSINEQEDLVKVYALDYGRIFVTSKTKLYQCPDCCNAVLVRPFAIPCTLYERRPFAYTKFVWPLEIIEDFRSRVLGFSCIVQFSSICSDNIFRIIDFSAKKKKPSERTICQEYALNNILFSIFDKSDLPVCSFKKGTTIDAFVTYVYSHKEIYFQPRDAEFFNIERILCEMTQSLNETDECVDFPQLGQLYISRFSDVWCRARIIGKIHDIYFIEYVDYGNIEIVTKELLKSVPDDLMYLPNTLLKCSLYLNDFNENVIKDIENYLSAHLENHVVTFYIRDVVSFLPIVEIEHLTKVFEKMINIQQELSKSVETSSSSSNFKELVLTKEDVSHLKVFPVYYRDYLLIFCRLMTANAEKNYTAVQEILKTENFKKNHPKNWKVGDACIHSLKHGEYIRAEIIKTKRKKIFEVIDVDSGKIHSADSSSMFIPSSECSLYPKLSLSLFIDTKKLKIPLFWLNKVMTSNFLNNECILQLSSFERDERGHYRGDLLVSSSSSSSFENNENKSLIDTLCKAQMLSSTSLFQVGKTYNFFISYVDVTNQFVFLVYENDVPLLNFIENSIKSMERIHQTQEVELGKVYGIYDSETNSYLRCKVNHLHCPPPDCVNPQAHLKYIDHGDMSISYASLLIELPDEISKIKPLAICSTLQAKCDYGIQQQMIMNVMRIQNKVHPCTVLEVSDDILVIDIN